MKTLGILSVASIAFLITSCMPADLPPAISEVNEVDHCTIGVGNMKDYSNTWNYTYTCTTDTNKLHISGAWQSGQLMVQVFDESGNSLFNKVLNNVTNSDYKMISPAGDWTMTVKAIGASGSFRVVLEKEN